MSTTQIRDIVQITSLTIAVMALIVWERTAYQGKFKKAALYMSVAPLVLCIHGIIFYVARFGIGLSPTVLTFTIWSSALRLHEYSTILIMGLQVWECIRNGR